MANKHRIRPISKYQLRFRKEVKEIEDWFQKTKTSLTEMHLRMRFPYRSESVKRHLILKHNL